MNDELIGVHGGPNEAPAVSNMAVVVTSISAPNAALRALADGCLEHGADFIVAGDTKSPADFSLEGCRFLSLRSQLDSDLRFPRACPVRHYARKNIGYLEAIRAGAEVIVETDDDNLPDPEFFGRRARVVTGRCVDGAGWINVYRYFTDALVWPRGFPLNRVTAPVAPPESLRIASRDCPIQQGLANGNPDVDAVYRLIMPLPLSFNSAPSVVLGPGSWCPFNSQNTSWWPDAYPLLYLPAYCSFRMTDIWRSFVAQRIAWAQGWSILFHGSTVRQHRNEHDFMRDFEDEIPGYLHNGRIAAALERLPIASGVASIPDSMRQCYEALVISELVPRTEMELLDCWLTDLDTLEPRSLAPSL
jgi:hypothetical protein